MIMVITIISIAHYYHNSNHDIFTINIPRVVISTGNSSRRIVITTILIITNYIKIINFIL